jgi:hypothetical protein
LKQRHSRQAYQSPFCGILLVAAALRALRSGVMRDRTSSSLYTRSSRIGACPSCEFPTNKETEAVTRPVAVFVSPDQTS